MPRRLVVGLATTGVLVSVALQCAFTLRAACFSSAALGFVRSEFFPALDALLGLWQNGMAKTVLGGSDKFQIFYPVVQAVMINVVDLLP